jgi:YHS domain-containing protein
VRVVLLLALVAFVVIVLLPLLRRPLTRGSRRPMAVSDELVKDPVCQTYVVRSRAVRGRGADGAPYFCSEECARRYVG